MTSRNGSRIPDLPFKNSPLNNSTPPVFPKLWTFVGTAWMVAVGVSFFLPQWVSLIISLSGGLLSSIAIVTRQLPLPRNNKTVKLALILLIFPIITCLLTEQPGSNLAILATSSTLFFSVVLGMMVLLRERKSLRSTWFILLSVVLAAFVIQGMYYFSSDQKGSFLINNQGLLLMTAIVSLAVVYPLKSKASIPGWLLLVMLFIVVGLYGSFGTWVGVAVGTVVYLTVQGKNNNRYAPVIGIIVVLLFYLVSLSQWGQGEGLNGIFNSDIETQRFQVDLSSPSGRQFWFGTGFENWQDIEATGIEKYGLSPVSLENIGNDWLFLWLSTGILGIISVIILLSVLVRESYKDLKSWDKLNTARHLYLGGVIAIISMVISSFFQVNVADGQFLLVLSVAFGLVFMSRERLIHEDFTRHPRRKQTHLKEHFRELVSASKSLLIFLSSIFFTQRTEDTSVFRRTIDPDSETIYCPYTNNQPNWIPVFIHIHSNRWEGAFSPEDTVSHFESINAGAVVLTDHNRITEADHPLAFLPAYEHGWGFHSRHVLVLGAQKTTTELNPLRFLGNRSNPATLSGLRKTGDYLILAHPESKNAWKESDVRELDYDAIEVFNKSAVSEDLWDEALTSGRLVWGTAGDDCHDLRSRHQTGKRYILVDLPDGEALDRNTLIEILRGGHFLSVWHQSRELTTKTPSHELALPKSFSWKGGRLEIVFDKPVEKAELIGAGGKHLGEFLHTENVKVQLETSEPYRRVVYESAGHRIILNPVARISKSA